MKTFKSRSFQSPKTGDIYILHQGNQLPPHPRHLQRLSPICNQEDVYLLFHFLKGRSYTEEDAAGFFQWIDQGWKDQSHFVFFVTTSHGDIAAALDIKSNSLQAAEIGYWCDLGHRGITAAAVLMMMDWAKNQGYESLYANPINSRSSALLARNGFIKRASLDSLDDHWTINLLP